MRTLIKIAIPFLLVTSIASTAHAIPDGTYTIQGVENGMFKVVSGGSTMYLNINQNTSLTVNGSQISNPNPSYLRRGDVCKIIQGPTLVPQSVSCKR